MTTTYEYLTEAQVRTLTDRAQSLAHQLASGGNWLDDASMSVSELARDNIAPVVFLDDPFEWLLSPDVAERRPATRAEAERVAVDAFVRAMSPLRDRAMDRRESLISLAYED